MFENVSARPRRRGTLFVSLAIHGLVAAALVVGPTWAVEEPPEPQQSVSIFQPFQAPVPPAEEPIRVSMSERPRTKGNPLAGNPKASSAARAVLAPPSEIPATLPAPPDEPFADDALFDQPSGPAAGGPGLGLVPGPGGDDPEGDEILPANAPNVLPPVPIFTPDPLYPEAARRVGMQGLVILEAIIGVDGAVQNVRVLRSANPLLDRAAEDAVLRWRYRPAFVERRTVAVYLTVTVDFRIHR